LSDAAAAQQRFEAMVRNIWGETPKQGIRKLEKGTVISGMTLDEALKALKIEPDVTGGDALWVHRSIDGADWYYVCAPKGRGFNGTLDFRNHGNNVEIWDPVTGKTATAAEFHRNGNRTSVSLDLPQAGSCFVVFRKTGKLSKHGKTAESNKVTHPISLDAPWTLSFPSGWGAPSVLQIPELKPWKDLDISDEAKAFSGTATYTTTFDVADISADATCSLDLGQVEMIAVVSVNGKELRTLWTPPYSLDITEAVKTGKNTLTVEVTGTWFNRLVYDAGQPEDKRKTWTINGPGKDSPLRASGLLGPVKLNLSAE
jgi:hypothetical protein